MYICEKIIYYYILNASLTMSIPLVPICVCGCNGSRSTSSCIYSDQGRDTTEQACSAGGQVTNIDQLTQIWSTFPCQNIYEDILFTSPVGIREYNPCNLARVQADIDHLLTQYRSYGYDFTSDKSSPKYNPFQETLIGLCSSPLVPGGCDLFLTNFCSQMTREQIESDPAMANMCGCYASPQYNTTTLEPACDPICHIVNTAQKALPCSGEITTCSNTVCAISDVNINLVNSSVVPAFQQICSGCTNPAIPCTCIISGVNVVNTLNDAGVGAQYTQYCGPNSQCFRDDGTGKLTPVTCPTQSDFNPGGGGSNPLSVFWAAVIVIGGFALLIFIFTFARYWRPSVRLR